MQKKRCPFSKFRDLMIREMSLPTHAKLRCVHWDLLRTTREPQMHKHRNSNVICHLFPTRQIYAHKSFPTLCFGGFIAIIGHLCHSHPVLSLGKNPHRS